jgi:G-protein alpha subunit
VRIYLPKAFPLIILYVSFCESVDRIFAPNYSPTLHDAFRSRVRTIGIHETVLTSNTYPMRFIDTGGELSERRKWLPHFENVTAVFFVVALSDYNRSFNETGSSSVVGPD